MIVLIDSSAWIEFVRRTGSHANHAVRDAIRSDEAATTDAVRLELLAGVARTMPVDALSNLLDGCQELDQERQTDVETAASLYLICRRAGETVRSLNDCLIAAIAIRHRVAVLHQDRDFEVLARHTDLQVVTG